MSSYYKTKKFETQNKCSIIERLDMNYVADFERAKELVNIADNENFQLSIEIEDDQEYEKDNIYFFLWDPFNNKICGMMIIKYLRNMDGKIDAITLRILSSRSFKDSLYKNERIGSILINELINEAKNDDRIDFITIESVAFDNNAHIFYKKMGFQFVGTTKRPLLIIRKKPSFNRFQYIDQYYINTEGYNRKNLYKELNDLYSKLDIDVDPEDNSSIYYKDDELHYPIYCKNFEKKGYNILIDYIYNNIKQNKVIDNLKKIFKDDTIFYSLIFKSIEEGNYNVFLKILRVKMSVTTKGENVYFDLNKIQKFSINNINDLLFKIHIEYFPKIVIGANVNIGHPFSNKIHEFMTKRWSINKKKDK